MDGDLDGFDRQLGDRLKALRTRRGLSLADVASEIGISYQQLQKHEAGRNSLTVHRLVRIANALEVDLQTILEVLTSPDGRGELSNFLPLQRLGERHRLLKAYFSIPEETRLVLLGLIEGTAGRNSELR